MKYLSGIEPRSGSNKRIIPAREILSAIERRGMATESMLASDLATGQMGIRSRLWRLKELGLVDLVYVSEVMRPVSWRETVGARWWALRKGAMERTKDAELTRLMEDKPWRGVISTEGAPPPSFTWRNRTLLEPGEAHYLVWFAGEAAIARAVAQASPGTPSHCSGCADWIAGSHPEDRASGKSIEESEGHRQGCLAIRVARLASDLLQRARCPPEPPRGVRPPPAPVQHRPKRELPERIRDFVPATHRAWGGQPPAADGPTPHEPDRPSAP